MAFIRHKVVSGKKYYQAVRSYRKNGRHRQEVLVHLGKHDSLDAAIAQEYANEVREKSEAARLLEKAEGLGNTILKNCGKHSNEKIPSLEELQQRQEIAWNLYQEEIRKEELARPHTQRIWDRVFEERRKWELVTSCIEFYWERSRALWEVSWCEKNARKHRDKAKKLQVIQEKYFAHELD